MSDSVFCSLIQWRHWCNNVVF